MHTLPPVHPRGTQARVLLASVFGPYGRDDVYGSRAVNPMELYHNQVTRVQGPFSLRMFHPSFGLMMIQTNIAAPCTLLDFPTRERFIQELKTGQYDIVGISGIVPTFGKVREMCHLTRRYAPGATVLVGGHIADMPGVRQALGADHIVRGEGVRWMRAYLGQDVDAPIEHPLALSGFGTRSLGVTLRDRPKDTAAILIPSVGCPMGCNFCATSAHFGGKGKFVNFYETGDELFAVADRIARELGTRSFFVLDENFLLHKKRALRLLELMEQHDRSWSFYVFSSARVLRSYDIDQLVRLGIAWVWMGLEGQDSQYDKLSGIDSRQLVKTLQSHGICVLGSSIIGMENHTPETIDAHIHYAVDHDTDFHQFMLYSPVCGTPLYQQLEREGRLLSHAECPPADRHGQYCFNYRHEHIPPGMETELLLRAFRADFGTNGPSLIRMARTMLQGWNRYHSHPDARVRSRIAWQSRSLGTTYAAMVWAARLWYRDDRRMRARMDAILKDFYAAFGWKARTIAPLLGVVLYGCMQREDRRLARGWTYEPETRYSKNRAAAQAPAAAAQVPCDSQEVVAGGLLSICLRPRPAEWHPLMIDLHGVLNRITVTNLADRVIACLNEHRGQLALNFRGLTNVEHDALLRMCEKLTQYRDRVKLVSLEAVATELTEAVHYARSCFEVFSDEQCLVREMS